MARSPGALHAFFCGCRQCRPDPKPRAALTYAGRRRRRALILLGVSAGAAIASLIWSIFA